MIQRTIIDPNEKFITVEQVKKALGFSRDDKNDELDIILNTAIVQVEEVGNVSLRSYNVSLHCDYPNAVQTLYLHPVAQVTSVTSLMGDDVDFVLHYDKRRITLDTPQSCIIKYQTEALDKERQQPFINAIIRLCMWEFNRSESYADRNAIINSIRA